MGEVYAGLDEVLARRVALKAIRGEHRLQASARARFLREARILSQLDHPNICRIYEYIGHGDAEFLVLELIDGVTLGRAIREGIDPKRKLAIALEVARVLAAAHAVGVVHRDLKPDNVMLARDGQVKVLDFGLARRGAVEADAGDGDVAARVAGITADAAVTSDMGAGAALTLGPEEAFRTTVGSVMGTPLYMSPEQARGAAVTTASDMYSYGLLVQTLYSGRPPYDPTVAPPALLRKIQDGETLPPENVERDLARLIGRLKAKAPAARATAVEVVERLEWIRDKPRRRLRRLVAGMLVALVVLAGVKYTIDLRRERTTAETRRAQAEALIAFMLGDLRDGLEPLGRLELLDNVGDQALAYFAAVPESELSDAELATRATALYQIGDVRIKQGDLAAAMPTFEQAVSLGESLLARDPGNTAWLETLALAHFWLGNGHWNGGDLEVALVHFAANLELARRLADARPSELDLRMEVASGEFNVASVLEVLGELEHARAHLGESARTVEELLVADPTRDDWRFELATTHLQAGRIREALGNLRQALDQYRASLSILGELLERDPEHPEWLERLVVAHNHVGIALERLGRPGEARVHHEQSVRVAEALAARDATNSWWSGILAIARRNLGWLRYLEGDAAGALSALRAAEAALEELAARDPTRGQWQQERTLALIGVGSVLLAEGDAGGALDAVTRAQASLPGDDAGSSDTRSRRVLAECELLRGDILAERGDAEGAHAAWQRGLAAIEPVARGSREGSLLEPLARSLLRVGRVADAEPIVAALAEQGYVPPRRPASR
jgi:serine/threonine-protein kinase